MDAKEARIGNWVNFDGVDNPVKIDGIQTYMLSYNGNFTSIDDFEPITLTEKILINSGFSIREDDVCNHFHIGINNVTHDWLFDIKWLKSPYSGKYEGFPFYQNGKFTVNFVNQLQNLYFALNGEELKINL